MRKQRVTSNDHKGHKGPSGGSARQWLLRRLSHTARVASRRCPPALRPALQRSWRALRGRLEAERLVALRGGHPTSLRRARALAIPPVTVVVPAFNEQEFLPACLKSVLDQELENWECIVVDDASLDYTLDVAVEFSNRDSRFRVLRHESNAGLGAARNTGLRAANGELVTFLDADDFLYPRSLLARAVAAVEDPREDVVGSYCDWDAVGEDDSMAPSRRRSLKTTEIRYVATRGETPFIATAPMVRTEVLRRFGGFDESLPSAEDFDLWIRLLRHGYAFVPAHHVGVAYRQRRSGMVHSEPGAHAAVCDGIYAYVDRVLNAEEAVPQTPFVYHEAMATYMRDEVRTRRFVGFLTLAVATGDDEQVVRIQELLPAGAWWWIKRELDLPAIIRNAIYRMERADAALITPYERGQLAKRALNLAKEAMEPPQSDEATAVTGSAVPTLASHPTVEIREVAWRNPQRGPERSTFGGIVLVPMARYHVEELVPLADELERHGEQVTFMASGSVEDVRKELRRYQRPIFQWPSDLSELPDFKAVVVLNDWGPTRELLELARARGAPSFAKVEGVQDFEDVDTGRVRRPYRVADVVLCQGLNDVRALEGCATVVVGSSRLERIALDPERSFSLMSRLAVINSNFTYNVLTEHRTMWLESAIHSCRQAGADALVSQHHGESALSKSLPIALQPMRQLLCRADVLVSRFSTVPFEAMARGVPFVYHNPHGERVSTFYGGGDAFRMTYDAAGLADAIEEAFGWRGEYRARSKQFFQEQIDIQPGWPSAARAASAILERLDA